MANKSVYQLSARQILFLAFASALIAVGAVACLFTFSGNALQLKETAGIAQAEEFPAPNISDPSVVSDEQTASMFIERFRPASLLSRRAREWKISTARNSSAKAATVRVRSSIIKDIF
jgi:hypothetical protein